jgi:F-type H+-transporting ATPase subunit gamma
MASTRQLKSRVKSVKGTRQITKAMQLVAASKMRRAQDVAKQVELFSEAAHELLTYLRSLPDTKMHHLYEERPVKARLVVVITSDKGLAGAYNANVLKRYAERLQIDAKKGVRTKTLCIGRKANQFASRIKGAEVLGAYEGFPERPTENDLRAITTTLLDQFVSKEVDSVEIIYTEYQNSISQVAATKQLLPAGFEEAQEISRSVASASFEPSPEEVLEATTRRLIEVQLYQAYLDSVASEHSMRMIAMKNATDNAGDLIEDLTLEMNKVRQAGITQELAEISGGAEAMK